MNPKNPIIPPAGNKDSRSESLAQQSLSTDDALADRADETDAASDIQDSQDQSSRARAVLTRLTWLAIVLIVGSIVWLRQNQMLLEDQVANRLRINEEFTQRINSIDDKIFALTPVQSRADISEQAANNDWQLVGVQVALANRLYQAGDYVGADEALRAVRYQIDAGQLAISAPMKATLKQNLLKDIEYLTIAQNQPDAWQLHIVRMREVQAYLRGLNRVALSQQISRQDLLLHDANMTLNLAIGAAANRDKATMVHYLQDIADLLEQLERLMPAKESFGQSKSEQLQASNQADAKGDKPSNNKLSNDKSGDNRTQSDQSGKRILDRLAPQKADQTDSDATAQKKIDSVSGALYAIHELLANAPKVPPLATALLVKNNPPS